MSEVLLLKLVGRRWEIRIYVSLVCLLFDVFSDFLRNLHQDEQIVESLRKNLIEGISHLHTFRYLVQTICLNCTIPIFQDDCSFNLMWNNLEKLVNISAVIWSCLKYLVSKSKTYKIKQQKRNLWMHETCWAAITGGKFKSVMQQNRTRKKKCFMYEFPL